MDWREKVDFILGLMIVIVFFATLFGWPDEIISLTMEWGVAIILGVITSGISGEIIENFTGDFLKHITITIPIAGFNFSISLFFITTIVFKKIIFGDI